MEKLRIGPLLFVLIRLISIGYLRIFFISYIFLFIIAQANLVFAKVDADQGPPSSKEKIFIESQEEKLWRQEEADLDERYQDFYLRKAEQRKEKEAEKEAVLEQRKLRKQYREELEVVRRDFIKHRHKKESLEKYFPEHEAKVKEQETERKKSRRAFVKMRNQLNHHEVKFKKVPDREDVGLD